MQHATTQVHPDYGDATVKEPEAPEPPAGGKAAKPKNRLLRWLWIPRRVAVGLVVLFVVSVVVFLATQALPGDAAEAILGKDATPERLDALREQLNLGQPVIEQYLSWLGGILQGNFGNSLANGIAVADLIGPRLANSLVLLVLVALIAVPLSLFMGVVTAVRHRSKFDQITLTTSLALAALPEFVIGMILVMLFSTTVFPVLPAISLLPAGASPFSSPEQLVLPVLTLVIVVAPYLYRLIRISMIDILATDYLNMARLKGFSTGYVMVRHALPNALVPVIQASAIIMAYLLGGIVVMEYLFRYPGLGTLLTDAINNRDLPIIQATVLIYATATVLFNLLADVLTVVVTPRLRDRTGA